MKELIRNTNQAIWQFARLRRNRWITISIAAGIIFMFIQAVLRTVVYKMSDFNLFLDPAVEARFFGDDPFRNWLNSYNAFFYVVMSLLTPFARWFSIVIWTLISLLSYIYSIAIIRSLMIRVDNKPRLEAFVAPLLLLVLIFDNIQLGQTNMVMMFAMLVAVFYLEKGDNLKSGLALGFAIAYKVTPLIFVGYFIVKRKFAAAIYALVFSLVMMIIIPMLFYSPERSMEFFTSWTEMVIAPFFSGADVKTLNVGYYPTNQSLEAFLNRHFTNFGIENYGGWHQWLDPAFLTTGQVKTMGNIIKLLTLVTLSVITYFNRRKNSEVLLAEASLFMMAILIVSPSSWVNHFILITPAYVYLVNEVLKLRSNHKAGTGLIYALAIATVLIIGGSISLLQSYSVFFLALIIIFTVLLYHHYRFNFSRSS